MRWRYTLALYPALLHPLFTSISTLTSPFFQGSAALTRLKQAHRRDRNSRKTPAASRETERHVAGRFPAESGGEQRARIPSPVTRAGPTNRPGRPDAAPLPCGVLLYLRSCVRGQHTWSSSSPSSPRFPCSFSNQRVKGVCPPLPSSSLPFSLRPRFRSEAAPAAIS